MKIGLIGYGFMGGAHAAAIQSLPGMTLYALASNTRPSADSPTRGNLALKTATIDESVKWTPDWRDVINDPAVDAVDICLPTHLHQEVITAALQAGKHVLCEKPMSLHATECEELMAAAEKAGKVFMVAQVLRFMQPYVYAMEYVRKLGAGSIRSCQLQRSTGFPQWSTWLSDEARSGGAILDLLSHDLDQVLLWFGTPVSVSAVSIGEVDTAEITLRYPNDLKVQVTGGWLAPETPFSASFRVSAAESELHYDGSVLKQLHGGVAEEITILEHDAYADEIAYFVDCATRGVAPLRCPPADSARVVRLSELVKRSREEQGREMQWQ
ncbi:Gfo/Idh/MocA family protein [Terriglobus sp. 2YAB30_2]|uniref:Gfo/Idh/MocA family protein n=1 Tax=Terriglobus sp. 2YAB30_2 TaxID=3233023 RepID=UPI003F9C5C8C